MPASLELLSPAGNADIGIAAIDHGADAVYIGAPKFSARADAGVSVADITRLIRHAHLYFAKVYVALNTILTDRELAESLDIINEVYQLDADALIIQGNNGDGSICLTSSAIPRRYWICGDWRLAIILRKQLTKERVNYGKNLLFMLMLFFLLRRNGHGRRK